MQVNAWCVHALESGLVCGAELWIGCGLFVALGLHMREDVNAATRVACCVARLGVCHMRVCKLVNIGDRCLGALHNVGLQTQFLLDVTLRKHILNDSVIDGIQASFVVRWGRTVQDDS